MIPDPRPQSPDASWPERLFAALQYPLPHHALSAGMHAITQCDWPPLKDLLIRSAIRGLGIDLAEAVETDPTRYPSFNAFFTRALRPEARPLNPDPATLLCPVDGTVSQAGRIDGDRLIQAKGREYRLIELLGGDERWAATFAGGSFATIYLSPRDYHRIHMPLGGGLKEMIHCPGRLFSVNAATARTVPRLFARNERVITLFETEIGPMAVILVGAIFVGSMDTVWAGCVAPRSRRVERWGYGPDTQPAEVRLERGAEMGRFNMGSTVILLFPAGAVELSPLLHPDTAVRMGEAIGRTANSAAMR